MKEQILRRKQQARENAFDAKLTLAVLALAS